MFGDCTASTRKAEKTIAPVWDETLVFRDVPLFGDVQEGTMELKLELYDREPVSVSKSTD